MSASLRSATSCAKAMPASIKGKVFTTVDGGRLHTVVENRYAGSITGAVAGLFEWPEPIAINGKTHHVDREDYMRFLNENAAYTETRVDNIKDYVDVNALKTVSTQEKRLMRQYISQYKKANLLFQKVRQRCGRKERFRKGQKTGWQGNGIHWLRDDLISCKDAVITNKCLNGHTIWCKWCYGCGVRYCLAGRCKCVAWE